MPTGGGDEVLASGLQSRGMPAMVAAVLLACGLLPLPAGAALLLSTDGNTVYDTVNNISWLADANTPAANQFGLPLCGTNIDPKTCINPSGSMSYQAAANWVRAMNAANYLGHNTWQIPTNPLTDMSCPLVGPNGGSFGYTCMASALASLYYSGLGLQAPNTAVPLPDHTIGPFTNFQPYSYWAQSSTAQTFSFNSGWVGSNTQTDFLYVLPMIPGKIPGTPAATGTGLQVNPGGQTIYDPLANVTWLANANIAATNRLGLPPCTTFNTPRICVAQDGAMNTNSASQFVANMNTYNGNGYLGQTNWQLPPLDASCMQYNCNGTSNPMGQLYYNQLGLTAGTSVVPTPDIAVGPFTNIQPYLYWACQADHITDACQTTLPAPGFEWSFTFGSGFQGTDIFANDLYVTAYFVGQPSNLCTYSLNAGGQEFPASGGTGSIVIAAAPGCPWSAAGAPSWITGATSGNGNGTFTYQVGANAGSDRSVTISVAGISFTIDQEAASIPGLLFIGSMPHLAAEENWITTLTLVNKSNISATARLSFFGDPSGPLTLPLTFPQDPTAPIPLVAASLDQAISSNASAVISTGGPQVPPVEVGSAQIAGNSALDGFAIFHQIVTSQEAVVPMETRNANSYLLAFDNTSGLVLGVAVENVSAANAVIPVVICDENGVVISAPGASISVPGNGHSSFVLSDSILGFPVTANIRGTIEFDTPIGGQISVLGLRFTPPNNALTTIPALANVGTGGGSIAHLASGGDGWQTTFVLVNTGTNAVPFTLSFFADQTGAPMSLPLSFPQPNGGTPTLASSVTQHLAARATRVIVSTGAVNLLTGSAQLTSTGRSQRVSVILPPQ